MFSSAVLIVHVIHKLIKHTQGYTNSGHPECAAGVHQGVRGGQEDQKGASCGDGAHSRLTVGKGVIVGGTRAAGRVAGLGGGS